MFFSVQPTGPKPDQISNIFHRNHPSHDFDKKNFVLNSPLLDRWVESRKNMAPSGYCHVFLCSSTHTPYYTVFLINHTMVYLASSLVFFSLLFSTPFLFGWFTNGSHIIESSLKHFSAQYTSTTLSRTFWSYLLSCLNPTSECVSYFYSPIESRKTIVSETFFSGWVVNL